MTGRFDGATVLVTGSTRGIGRAIAEAFLLEGAIVVLNGRHPGSLGEAREEILASQPAARDRLHSADFDVLDADQVARKLDEVSRTIGPIDILVNNAGVQRRAPILEMELSVWKEVIDTNLTGAFIVGKAVAPAMIEARKGKIINICSVQSSIVRPTTSPYAAAKGGLANLTKSMCAEWAEHGLQVNGIAPGYIKTELNSALIADASFDSWVVGRTPARRWGEVADLIGPVLWLASDGADFVNGQVIYVDGGMTAVV